MTPAFGGQYSIQLSYGRLVLWCSIILSRPTVAVLCTAAVLLSSLRFSSPAELRALEKGRYSTSIAPTNVHLLYNRPLPPWRVPGQAKY